MNGDRNNNQIGIVWQQDTAMGVDLPVQPQRHQTAAMEWWHREGVPEGSAGRWHLFQAGRVTSRRQSVAPREMQRRRNDATGRQRVVPTGGKPRGGAR
jgi:hypothetical protein